ncbi:hypothetical protein Tco_1365704, partial [Tanacetum coccineum]
LAPLPPRSEQHLWLRFDVQDYVDSAIQDFEDRLGRIYDRQVYRVQVLDFDVLTKEIDQAILGDNCLGFIGGLRRQMSWSLRVIASKAELRDYSTRVSSSSDFLIFVPSYTQIREPLRRLCHRLIVFTIASKGQVPEKVTTTDLFFLRSMDEGMPMNIPYLLAQYLFRFFKGGSRELRCLEANPALAEAARMPQATATTPKRVGDRV